MMIHLCSELLAALNGRTFSTAESCTGGGIGATFTAVPGSSAAYKGGIISYTNWVKENLLGVPTEILATKGAVSEETARAMAVGVRKQLRTTMAVSVTGIAGPDSDEFRTPVGTVYIGYADSKTAYAKKFFFEGNRELIRNQATRAALEMLLRECTGEGDAS